MLLRSFFGLRLLKGDLETAVIADEGTGGFMWCTIAPLLGHAFLGRSLVLVRGCRVSWSSYNLFRAH